MTPVERSSVCCVNTDHFCCKALVGLAVITALAVTTLGLLAMAGMLYPSTGLGVVTNFIGQEWAFATLTAGVALMGILLVCKSLCCGGVAPRDDSRFYSKVDGLKRRQSTFGYQQGD